MIFVKDTTGPSEIFVLPTYENGLRILSLIDYCYHSTLSSGDRSKDNSAYGPKFIEVLLSLLIITSGYGHNGSFPFCHMLIPFIKTELGIEILLGRKSSYFVRQWDPYFLW